MFKMAVRENVSCGLDYVYSPDLNNCIDQASRNGYDFICAPIINPRFKREFLEGPAIKRGGPLTRSDMLLTSQDWGSLVVAKISPWLQIDSTNDIIRRNSERAYKQELMFASHLSCPAIMTPVTGPNCANLARIVNEHILAGYNHQYWMQIPTKAAVDEVDDVLEFGGEEGMTNPDDKPWTRDTWNWWNTVRTICDSSKKVGIALEVTADLPPSDVLDRWCGEPIKCAIIPTRIFLTNRKGFPVLSKAHQSLLKKLFKLDVQLIVSGTCRHPGKGMRTYHQYLNHLWQTQDPPDNVETFSRGYEDFLQCPLQPLKDNLESQTYEVFEKDPIKYSQYQKAVYHALLHRVPAEEKDTKTQIVMVLGAGRGPLVSASIQAASKAERKIKVYAVEKNPNAVVTLENFKYELWGEQVTVVSTDMRFWDPPEKADIIVSELLGSFGDNELSPECLDGAQKFLKDDGISIPKSYTSYLAPLTSSKLWNEARICKDSAKPPEAPFETPYVVRLHNVHILDTAKPLFRFDHPNKGLIDNGRYGILEFDISMDTVLHGFAGYFDCVLFGDDTLSIVPETHSPGMFSWFPLYFPIKEPVHVLAGDRLVVHMWRMCTEKNVWYEWCITEPIVKNVHNPKGRSYTIEL